MNEKKDGSEIVFIKQVDVALRLNKGEFKCYCDSIDIEDLASPVCHFRDNARTIWVRIYGLRGDIQMLKKDCTYQFMLEDDYKTVHIKDVRIDWIESDDIICSAQSMYIEMFELNLNIQV